MEEIDRLNILQATMLAMQRAVNGLRLKPSLVQVDGNRIPRLDMQAEAIVKGMPRCRPSLLHPSSPRCIVTAGVRSLICNIRNTVLRHTKAMARLPICRLCADWGYARAPPQLCACDAGAASLDSAFWRSDRAMNITEISSRDNAFVKELRRLSRESGMYRKLGHVWLEGDHLCRAALTRGLTPKVAVF